MPSSGLLKHSREAASSNRHNLQLGPLHGSTACHPRSGGFRELGFRALQIHSGLLQRLWAHTLNCPHCFLGNQFSIPTTSPATNPIGTLQHGKTKAPIRTTENKKIYMGKDRPQPSTVFIVLSMKPIREYKSQLDTSHKDPGP